MRLLAPLLTLLLVSTAPGQQAPPNGPRRIDPGWHALTGATVHVSPGNTTVGATVVFRDGRIVSVGMDAPPAGARVTDCAGLHIYPGFIDAHVAVEPEPNEPKHWNRKVTPERIARAIDEPTAKELRALGFTAAVAAPRSGIFRGRASLVSLAPRDPDRSVRRPTVYRQGVYQALGFEFYRGSDQGYPTSLMGAIAVLRQSFFDGLAPGQTLLFDTEDELDALRAAKIAREFKRDAILLGSGLEFRRLHAIKADGLPIILPVRFPPLPKVDSVGARDAVDLRELMTWEWAPDNLSLLSQAGPRVALTTSKLEKRSRFWKQVREMHGAYLAALTTAPAAILGVADRMGTLEPGRLANLSVWTGRPDEKKSKLLSVWIEGERHEIHPRPGPDLDGKWELDGQALVIEGEKATLGKERARRFEQRGDRVDLVFGDTVFSGVVEGDAIRGHAVGPGGRRSWTAKRTGRPLRAEEAIVEFEESEEPEGYPFGPYALEKPPEQAHAIFVNATLWTCGPAGTVENGELEIEAGKVVYAGPSRGSKGTDLGGRHITPGIIDCHSHTGISRGVNDSGQAVTAEVRIGDVTDPDSISWYRQLAGGVTAANCLHGSANPIGGQNQVVKLRWGVRHPDEMHFEGAMPGIKFALGENVKQSNWGDKFKSRYPQTRMGVETLLRDRFAAAREYLKGHDKVDLELEALAEILEGKRWVHCHSYRQDEILMLCRIAREFGFRIGVFQHILEGYKVADEIKANAVGASAFSDWWAYKIEVQDAIPYNGAIMHRVGVNVSFNSDSNDLARRLNTEATKAIKYGGLPREEAIRFVTLNPAIQLGIEKRVGSLEPGKDADLAIWSGDPLSAYSICVSTWVDGREYFSLEKDRKHREEDAKLRDRIIAKILERKPEKERDKREGEQQRWWAKRFRTAACGECEVDR